MSNRLYFIFAFILLVNVSNYGDAVKEQVIFRSDVRASNNPIAPPEKGIYLGQTEIGKNDVADLEAAIGRKVSIYADLDIVDGIEDSGPLAFDLDRAQELWDQGYIVLASAYEAYPKEGFTVDRLLQGDYDDHLQKLADQFREFGNPMFFTTAREPNGVGSEFFGGFGPRGDKSIEWGFENQLGFDEFDPSKFPNSQLYEGLGNPNVCDGLERIAAAQRYYYDFFISKNKLEFLAFDTMGWAALPAPKEEGNRLLESCHDFELFHSFIKHYSHWVSLNWYILTEPIEEEGVPQAMKTNDEYFSDLKKYMEAIRTIDPDKPVILTEFGVCGSKRREQVEYAVDTVLDSFSQIGAAILWGSAIQAEGHSFPSCLLSEEKGGRELGVLMDNSPDQFPRFKSN